MATLILTAIGTAIGGPVGGAIGAMIGQQADLALFKPKARRGPRLTELSVQTSVYGTEIPALHGSMRVAGSVIWATDLIERKTRQGNGKGRPDSIGYSYSASFAVALSARPIHSIGRIWADGSLLRGADGQFRQAVAMRVYRGLPDQPPDPLIAADVGPDACPAHHGLAYVMFEDLALADFGNRIPSLTFEVHADDPADPPMLGDMVTQLAPGLAADAPFAVAGLAASGENAAGALAPLMPVYGLKARGTALCRAGPWRSVATGLAEARPERAARSRDDLPGQLTLRHYDPARDYQIGAQSAALPARHDAPPAWRHSQQDLPMALDASDAQALVRQMARRALVGRRTAQLRAGPWAYALQPGDRLAIDLPDQGGSMAASATPGRWQIEAIEMDATGATLSLVTIAPAPSPLAIADGGDMLPSPSPDPGETRLALVDLPALPGLAATSPGWHAAVAGTGSSWRGATIETRASPAAPWTMHGISRPASAMGVCETILLPADPAIEDRSTQLIVALAAPEMSLSPATPEQLYFGANLAMVGAELIQFAGADPLPGGRYRLSALLRGRWGTEAAVAGHQSGAPFLLLDGTGLVPLGADAAAGTSVRAAATSGLDSADAAIVAPSLARRPLSPVHLRHGWHDDALQLRWVRRSRAGFGWTDDIDSPLDEAAEAWRVTISSTNGANFATDCASAEITLAAADLAPLRAGGATGLEVAICQIGAFGLSPALTAAIAL